MDDTNQRADQVMGGGGGGESVADEGLNTQHPDYQSGQRYEQQQQQQQQQHQQPAPQTQQLISPHEEVVQVVYQSDQHGSLVGVESTSLVGTYGGQPLGPSEAASAGQSLAYIDSSSTLAEASAQVDGSASSQVVIGAHQQLSRAASTLPSVAEESISSGQNGAEPNGNGGYTLNELPSLHGAGSGSTAPIEAPFGQQEHQHTADYQTNEGLFASAQAAAESEPDFQHPIYSTVNKYQTSEGHSTLPAGQQEAGSGPDYANTLESYANQDETYNEPSSDYKENLGDNLIQYDEQDETNGINPDGGLDESMQINQEISQIIARQKAGAVEKGSFRHNFRKKLGLSVSTNENDLTAHRQKFFEQVQDGQEKQAGDCEESAIGGQQSLLPVASHKFKRTHSVSFNVGGSRGNRHSVDIRNLPSYLTHKRASIVDVAKGAMSSLISSLGGGGSGSNSVVSHRRDSVNYEEELEDNEPIFEEPIAPTLSLGQRVAMVRNSGTEFGTVGWIGQLPDIDDDWIVGVIFDNMIGDCDGAYKGVRYFYARESYAMFVPLSVLTKTDNYIGRPETGTVLSRMSVSLKPGQLISIQRSSIRLQHCFLNAPHQRVGHDVRAVSNRLHCQCHNCGPCAHLTKQGRPSVLPHFGAHHLPIKKKNSLAHAAVEMLAHHHHHFHEEEEHDEKDYEFGDNAAHACNFVRYSCCQQSGQPGHEFSSDCGMVRPELLDNLIHAPKAPHRRSRPRRKQQRSRNSRTKQRAVAGRQLGMEPGAPQMRALEMPAQSGLDTMGTLETNQSTLTAGTHTLTSTLRSSAYDTTEQTQSGDRKASVGSAGSARSRSSYMSSSAAVSASGSQHSSCSGDSSRSQSPARGPSEPYNYYQYDTSSFRPQNNVYKTVDSQVSIVDQQRFVFARDSSAFVQSPLPSNWSDSQVSSLTTSGLGTRLLRCLGCLKRPARRSRPRRKLSFKDKVLEYRRRQSTFVPSTLAKPQEDFASHGLMYPGSAPALPPAGFDANSDYSSCSRSNSSSGSESPYHRPELDGQRIVAEINTQNPLYQQQSIALEHGQANSVDEQLKSSAGWASYLVAEAEQEYRRLLNYGDYNLSDAYETDLKGREHSKDSALTDFAYSDTYKTDCSSDTLKHLVDHSINEQVELPQPIAEHQVAMSPLSSVSGRPACECNASTISDQVDVSSPTASAMDQSQDQEENEEREVSEDERLRAQLDNMQLNSPDDSHKYSQWQ